MLNSEQINQWNIDYASEEDINCWMALVRLVIDGFPHLYEDEYIQVWISPLPHIEKATKQIRDIVKQLRI